MQSVCSIERKIEEKRESHISERKKVGESKRNHVAGSVTDALGRFENI